MHRLPLQPVTIGVILFACALGSPARAGGPCCARCGSPHNCSKVCRLVCEETKVQVTCWGVREEPFCVPGPSKRCGTEHEQVCGECQSGPHPVQAGSKPFVWSRWTPEGQPKLFTRQKLMKKTVTKPVPSYRWVVEDLCDECAAKTPGTG
jgi:hypothetical protein